MLRNVMLFISILVDGMLLNCITLSCSVSCQAMPQWLPWCARLLLCFSNISLVQGFLPQQPGFQESCCQAVLCTAVLQLAYCMLPCHVLYQASLNALPLVKQFVEQTFQQLHSIQFLTDRVLSFSPLCDSNFQVQTCVKHLRVIMRHDTSLSCDECVGYCCLLKRLD